MSVSSCGVLDSSLPHVGSLNIYAYDLGWHPISHAVVRLDVVVWSTLFRRAATSLFRLRADLKRYANLPLSLLFVGVADIVSYVDVTYVN